MGLAFLALALTAGCHSPKSKGLHAAAAKSYDDHFQKLVVDHWLQLVEKVPGKDYCPGKVVLWLRQLEDGQVMDVAVHKNTANAVLAATCQRAVMEAGPYGTWPLELRKALGRPYRTIRYTFTFDPKKAKPRDTGLPKDP